MFKTALLSVICCLLCLGVSGSVVLPLTSAGIRHDPKQKTIKITDLKGALSIDISYANGCKIARMTLRGKELLSPNGAFTGIRTDRTVTSLNSSQKVVVKQGQQSITLSNIVYFLDTNDIHETWTFTLNNGSIGWQITREYDSTVRIEETFFPKWNFNGMNLWKGGIIDNGGMVWCKYLASANDTYGVHTAGVTFWEPTSGDALRIESTGNSDSHLAATFSNSGKNKFTFTQMVSDSALQQRYHLSRFVSGKPDVFAAHNISKKIQTINLNLTYIDYNDAYSRGQLNGIDAVAVRELMNTTGRYGVVDNNIVGGNGWLTNWKCLHEPFFAQIGMALNDQNYVRNFSATLDQERDLATLPDGRVLSRWHNAPGDEIPGTYNLKTGYYEAMWGYTIDSQTGYVINVSEQFDLNGDAKWLKGHKESCERALDWLIKRDENKNGIFEMKNANIADKKASDWLDIVWASYENAFVNAQMFEALNLWADSEMVLGDTSKATYYRQVAAKLKTAFNLPVEQGGFWSEAKKQYVYWRDRDGSVHGDNLVTPVNFAAVAFGLCDDPGRKAQLLDQIEKRTAVEKLFHWPLCFDSYKREEVDQGNWPFPKYENGDIFPTWGYMGVRAYAGYDKSIALKYIRNILNQYNEDGLSSQRYSRQTQKGLGDDILAGISTTITALYRDIYGIRPKWNRMGLEPHMIAELNGTKFSYNLRDTVYHIELAETRYTLSTKQFSISSNVAFGASQRADELLIFMGNEDKMVLAVKNLSGKLNNVVLRKSANDKIEIEVGSNGKYKLENKSKFKKDQDFGKASLNPGEKIILNNAF
jgi:hypothetical protein